MNLKILILATLCLIALPLFTSAEKENIEEITIKKGAEFSVEVYENGTTGHFWFFLSTGTEDPIKLIRKEAVPEPAPTKMMVGRGHTVRFIFRAKKEGSSLINLVYKRMWENEIAQYKTVRVNVIA